MTNPFPIINASTLVQIRSEWQMSQSEFAKLLNVSVRTYQGWEVGRTIPAQVQAHVRSIGNLRLIYQHWDKIATPLAGTEEFDGIVDSHEKLWAELFPALKRE